METRRIGNLSYVISETEKCIEDVLKEEGLNLQEAKLEKNRRFYDLYDSSVLERSTGEDEKVIVDYDRWIRPEFLDTLKKEVLRNKKYFSYEKLIGLANDPEKCHEFLNVTYPHGSHHFRTNGLLIRLEEGKMKSVNVDFWDADIGIFVNLMNNQFGLKLTEEGLLVTKWDFLPVFQIYDLNNRLEDLIRVMVNGWNLG